MENIEEDTRGQRIAVFWCLDIDKANAETIKRINVSCVNLNVNRAIMICKEQTSIGKKENNECQITLETFQLDDLQVNITEHELVPQHVVLDDEEKQELLKKYRIKDH